MSGSARSPARNSARNCLRSYCETNLPCGSSFLMARNAVGAVNSVAQWYSEMTRQKAPASGVPTGLPCTGSMSSVDQRRVDDVAVADHPADVGGRPEHLARAHA